MASSRLEEVAGQSLQRAEDALIEQHYAQAFSHYVLLIRLQPAKKLEVKEKFSLSLRELGESLAKSGQVKDLLTVYEQACELYPECETIHNDMGSHLFRLGYWDEAACCFRRALKIDPDFLAARENLDNISSHLVERWHFRMLNDRRRNESFQSAIHRAIKDGFDEVLDIGSGTGLLSLYALEGGAKRIVGCEMSKTMYEMACDVVGTNQMADRIHLIHKKSTDLNVPEDLERVSLLVTETFDAGLLGEHILPTLQHAWKSLLKENHKQCRVIPEKAKVFACAVECESIRKENRVLYPGMQYIDLSDVELVANTSVSNHLLEGSEPYTTERLQSLRGGCKFLSEPIAVAHFNFDNPQSIDHYIKGFCHDLEILITVNGRVDAIVTWFDLYLDKEHSLSSAPGMHSCWEQVVYPVLPSHLLEKDANENLLVRHGDLLNVNCECSNNALHFRCNRIARSSQVVRSPGGAVGTSSKSLGTGSSTGNSMSAGNCSRSNVIPVTVHDLQRQYQPFTLYSSNNIDMIEFSLRSQCGSVLNNDQHPLGRENISGSSPCMDYSASYDLDFPPLLKPSVSSSCLGGSGGSLNHLDNNHHSFPSFLSTQSLRMLPNSSPMLASQSSNNKLSYFLERQEIGFLNDLDYNRMLCKAMSVLSMQFRNSSREFNVMDLSSGVSMLPLQAVKLGAQEVCVVGNSPTNQELLCYLTTANSLDPQRVTFSSSDQGLEECEAAEWGVLVVSDIVETCGCLRQQVLDDIALARVTCLRPDGVVLPQTIKVYGMVIESSSLHRDSSVISDDSMCGFLVAAFMNDFQMTTHLDVDLTTLDYKKLTEPFELFSINFNDPIRNKVPSFLNLSKCVRVKAVESGQATAVIYWFDMELVDNVRVCTLSPTMHWKQAAAIQKTQVTVSCGAEIMIRGVCKNSCIGINVSLL